MDRGIHRHHLRPLAARAVPGRAPLRRRCRCSRCGGSAARCSGERRALLAVLAQEGVLYFTFFTPEFNHNVVLLPLWAAIGLAGYRACFEPAAAAAAADGLVRRAGGTRACWASTPQLLLLLPLLGWRYLHPRLRRCGLAPVPCWHWPSRCCCFCRTCWSVADRLRPAASFRSSARRGRAIGTTTSSFPLLFAAAQFGGVAAALLALALLAMAAQGEACLRCRSRGHAPGRNAPILWTITWGPAGLAVAASLILGLHLKDMWGYPMWCFIGLFVMAEAVGPFTTGGLQRFCRGLVAILVAVPVVFAIQQTIGGVSMRKPTRAAVPRQGTRRVVDSDGMMPSVTSAAGHRGWRCLDGRQYRVLRRRASVRVHRCRSGQSPWITLGQRWRGRRRC